MGLTVAEVEGLSSLKEEDLTVDEAIELASKLEEKEDKEQKEKTEMEVLIEALSSLEDAPTQADLDNWRDQYGAIHISTVMNESDLYIWRVLKRQEYKQLVKSGFLNEALRGEEAIVRKCLLYPQVTDKFISSSSAGAISALKEQIMYKSAFIPESLALSQIKTI